MSDKYLSLVAVKHYKEHDRSFLFEAPRLCNLKVGDTVLCDTQYGEAYGKVTAVSEYVRVGSPEYCFVVLAMGAHEPLKKIIGRIVAYEYEKEDE